MFCTQHLKAWMQNTSEIKIVGTILKTLNRAILYLLLVRDPREFGGTPECKNGGCGCGRKP